MNARTETLPFQAETRQLLQLMVHSIYTNKDIFLRELVSNASDALDKLRLEAQVDKELQVDTSDLCIVIEVDRDNRTLTVRDNGIGMSRDDVVSLIGTIAKSGTAELVEKLKAAADAAGTADLIGQFGVGFYSTFMVADRVTLLTRRAGQDTGTRWESTGDGTYVIETVDQAPQGTSVTLHLKPEDAEDKLFDYTVGWRVREIVKRYSDFIAWPIRMAAEQPAKANTEGDSDTEADPDSDTEVEANTEVNTEANTAPVEWETLNSMKALWARPKAEVSEQEYREFYRHISHDWTDPLETLRLKAEGRFEYEALLFIPAHAPFDLFSRDGRRGLQLYVKRVFIMDDCAALLPEYLRFVKGVVDAQDLSLNISREILQQDRQIEAVRRRLVKKVLSTVKELMDTDAQRYQTFWREFGRAMKEGLLSDVDNRTALLDIASFASTHDPDQVTTLAGYTQRMKPGQADIYFMTGESRVMIENSPHIEAFRAREYEVLLLTDPVDEVWVDTVREYDGKALRSIAKGQVDLDAGAAPGADEPDRAQQEQDFAALLGWLSTTLHEQVKAVRLSTRLTTSAACVVGDAHDVTPTLEKMYRAMGQDLPQIKRILELNPGHPLVARLRTAHAEHPDDAALAELAELLYAMALLAEGGELADPARFTRLLADRLARSI